MPLRSCTHSQGLLGETPGWVSRAGRFPGAVIRTDGAHEGARVLLKAKWWTQCDLGTLWACVSPASLTRACARAQERKAAVIRAEGESESARLISEATRSAGPGMIELRRIEAARDVASTLAKSGSVVYLPGGNTNMLLGINPAR